MVHFLRHRAAALIEASIVSLLLFGLVGALGVQLGAFGSARAGTGAIAGVAYEDVDRDAVRDAGEAALVGHQLFLITSTGTYVGTALTGADGTYKFEGLSDGGYRLVYAEETWAPMREGWAPTTTGSVFPEANLTLAGSATADFGWRPVSRSTNVDEPVSSFTGPSGLRVRSYTDAIDATFIHDVLASGLVGPEAGSVTVFFGIGEHSSTSTSVGESDGAYSGFSAYVYVTYLSWLSDRGMTLSHEYGHAWSLYHAYMTHGDPSFAAYLAARGLAADARVDTSYLWNRRELIAEDYRQLLGAPGGRPMAQPNADIPAATSVAGLAAYLSGAFVDGSPPPLPTAAPTPAPAPTASPGLPPPPTPMPTPSPTGTPPTPMPTAAIPGLSVAGLGITPTPVMKSATVTFGLSLAANARVLVTTPGGSVVRVLADGQEAAGPVLLTWDRKDDKGRRVRAGTYNVTVEAIDAAGRRAFVTLSFKAG